MMGIKERACAPLPAVTLDDLVPADHFYRHLERALDLTFVRDLGRDCYTARGRPSAAAMLPPRARTTRNPEAGATRSHRRSAW